MNIVHGSWALRALAGEAAAWIFVYPRQTSLLQNYIEGYGNGAVMMIVLVGSQGRLRRT